MSLFANLTKHVRSRIVSGILVLVPLGVTFVVLRFLYRIIIGYVRPVAALMSRVPLPEYAVGLLAVLALLLMIYAMGTLTRLVIGRRLVAWGESLLARIPVVKSVYSWTKSLVDMLSRRNRNAFKSVVIIDFPRPGLRALGFVGGEGVGSDGRRHVRVFLPTSPNPTSGYLLIVDEAQVTRTTITVEEGIRMVVSGGVLVPEELDRTGAADPAATDGKEQAGG